MLQSDADGYDIWLVTTDAWQFYEYLGFAKLRSDIVGDDNSTWKGGPISIHIVRCQPRKLFVQILKSFRRCTELLSFLQSLSIPRTLDR